MPEQLFEFVPLITHTIICHYSLFHHYQSFPFIQIILYYGHILWFYFRVTRVYYQVMFIISTRPCHRTWNYQQVLWFNLKLW